MELNDLETIWRTTLAQLEIKMESAAQFKTWFRDTRLISINDKTADIGVKSVYAADWLSKRHNRIITETISYVYGNELKVKFIIDKELSNVPQPKVTKEEFEAEKPLFGVRDGVSFDLRNAIEQSGLNPHYTFSNFVVGESNRLAHAAALAISNQPGAVYNPLFIYGKTGLGKTHLAQAVGRSIIDREPSKKIVFVSAETFMNDMVNAIQTGKNVEFRNRFRKVDALIIDDIQLIAKREKTQEEFFNTFNYLYNLRKQIILTSDVPPERLADVDERLKSRFQGGMVAEIYKPDLETRLAIIQKKINSMGITLPRLIVDFVAQDITDNIREIEGAIQKLALYNSMSQHDLTIEEARKILGRDLETKRSQIKLPQILKRVAQEFKVTVKDIKGAKRTANVALARQICMYILRKELKFKLEKVADIMNKKDHTTVMHAVDKIESQMLIDENFKKHINFLIEEII